MTRRLRSLWVVALAIAFFAGGVRAQDTSGKIVGAITDSSGAVVSGAVVTVTNTGTGIAQKAKTDSTGYYEARNLPIGSYQVAAEAEGFNKAVSAGTSPLGINQTLRVDLQLSVGTITNVVSVTAETTSVETQNQTVGKTVVGEAIVQLPLNGRDTLSLLSTQPGVVAANPRNSGAGGYSIAGGKPDSVTYLLDGGLNNNLLNNAVVANPNPDAVAEFRVLQSNYSAEYGRNAGGVVSVATRSGGNNLHGSAFDYLRNDAFNANTFFNNEQGLARPVLKRNQFGATLGGPIYLPKIYDGRNKLFFFFAYQGQRQSALDVSQGKVTVPTPTEALGDFSKSYSGSNQVAAFLQKNPYFQPDPTLAAQGIIDPTRIDPIAKKYFAGNLIPTAAAGYLYPQGSARANNDEFLGKVDYHPTERDTVAVTLTARTAPTANPFSNSANVLGYPTTTTIDTYFGNAVFTHTFTPTLVNELRITAQRYNEQRYVPATTLPTAHDLGIAITPDQPTGPPLLSFAGSGLKTGFGYQGPTTLANNTYVYADTVSYIHGQHALKAGGYFSVYQNNTFYNFYVNGRFVFNGSSTTVGSGNSFADFLMGLPDSYSQWGSGPTNVRSRSYAGFVQDEWKVSRRLTLSFGVRYEYNAPKYDTEGRTFSFIPGLKSTRFVNSPVGLVYPGDAGAPSGANFADKNDWAPRIGFAWDVFGNAKTSVRGGVGVFYDVLKAEDNLQFNNQAPFFSSTSLYFSKPNGTAPISLSDPFTSAGKVNNFPTVMPKSDLDFAARGFLPFGGSGVNFVDPYLRTPYVYQYNLSIQQQLRGGLMAEASYLGNSAHKMTALVDKNPYVPGTNYRVYDPGDPANSIFRSIATFGNLANGNYNALTLNLTERMPTGQGILAGSFFTAGYTYSHQLDTASGYRMPSSTVPAFAPKMFYGSGDSDLRHVVTISGGITPAFHLLTSRIPKAITKGWSIYPIVSYRSGFPLDVRAGFSTTPNVPGPSGAGDSSLVRADLVGSSVATFDAKTMASYSNPSTNQTAKGNFYFNPANFSKTRLTTLNNVSQTNPASLVGQFSYGSLPRNAFRGPGMFNINMAIAKVFRMGETKEIEFRLDSFNMLNSVQFNNPDTTLTSTTFGQISGTADPRILQLALHLHF